MRSAGQILCDHAELAVDDLERAAGIERVDAVGPVRAALAETRSAADYVAKLRAETMTAGPHRRVETTIKRVVEGACRIGQLAMMPHLADQLPASPAAASGEPRFDPWCLTDPDPLALWQRDAQSRRAVELLWRSDPTPERALAIQSELDESRDAGEIRYARSVAGNLGHDDCCPWAPIDEATRPVTIARRRLATGDRFTFDVSAEERAEGGAFTRELYVGEFHITDEVDYCDPRT